MSKRFAITGVAGYVAPRHLRAIRDTGNVLVAACDPNDSVGVLDSYFYEANFFREFERFDRHLEKLRRKGEPIDYLSICSPNYLHDAHIRLALRLGADAICEKPLVMNPWNIDALQELEEETGRRVNTVLQLRLHPAIVALKEKMGSVEHAGKHDITLTYVTSRGRWYLVSWKGDPERSGGLTTNIGIHFFDMLMWIFGACEHSEVHYMTPTKAAGYIELARARVKWFLSTDPEDLPFDHDRTKQVTYRSLTVNDREIEFSGGFSDLHTRVYEEVLAGRGFSMEEARPSIQLVHDIRGAVPTGICERSHPFLEKALRRDG